MNWNWDQSVEDEISRLIHSQDISEVITQMHRDGVGKE